MVLIYVCESFFIHLHLSLSLSLSLYPSLSITLLSLLSTLIHAIFGLILSPLNFFKI